MTESISQKGTIVAQVIEDLSCEPLALDRFTAELYRGPKEKLIRVEKTPQYKDNGYLVFPNVGVGDYTLRVRAEQFQTQQLSLTLAALVLDPSKRAMPQILAQTIVGQPGDNELIVVVTNVNAANKRINFDATTLRKPIPAGVTVLANGAKTTLAEKLDPGNVSSARLSSLTGIAAGAVVRIVRNRSIRMRFDPYVGSLAGLTRIVGAGTATQPPQPSLPDALVSITEINGKTVTIADVAGAKVATVKLGASPIVLGTNRDVQTLSDERGFYTLYFANDAVTTVTLTATLTGYQTATARNLAVTPGARVRADLRLTKA